MVDTIPPRLFKYQPYNTQTFDNLKDRTIWFSKPAEFNDPIELSATISADGITEAQWQALRPIPCVEVLKTYSPVDNIHRVRYLWFIGDGKLLES